SSLLVPSHLAPRCLPPFPTRRSSDLRGRASRSVDERPLLERSITGRLSGPAAMELRVPAPVTRFLRARRRLRQWWCGASERSQRSEEHTSELQSPDHLVCRLLLEKKN